MLWLVLEGKKDTVNYPKWLLHDYRKLWKDDKGKDFEPAKTEELEDIEFENLVTNF